MYSFTYRKYRLRLKTRTSSSQSSSFPLRETIPYYTTFFGSSSLFCLLWSSSKRFFGRRRLCAHLLVAVPFSCCVISTAIKVKESKAFSISLSSPSVFRVLEREDDKKRASQNHFARDTFTTAYKKAWKRRYRVVVKTPLFFKKFNLTLFKSSSSSSVKIAVRKA